MIPENVQAVWNAQWWMFLHIVAPLILVGSLVAGVLAWVYQTYYDN